MPKGPIIDEAAIFDTNVRACFNLADWSRSRGVKMTFISGAIVYLDPFARNIVETSMTGFSGLGGIYGSSKLLAEDVMRRQASLGLDLVILRPSSIYGDGLGADKMVAKFLAKASQDEDIRLRQRIDDGYNMVHAADVAEAAIAAIRHDASGIFNIGAEKCLTLLDIAKSCVDAVGAGSVSFDGSEDCPRSARQLFSVNCELAAQHMDWRPRVSFEAGLTLMIEGKS